jgi:hypothetical protein
VQGVVRISQDGSHVYFVAQGVLTSTPNGQGQVAQAGEDNLYVFERDAAFPNGRTSFIAKVAPSDEALWGSEHDSDSGRPAQATPDGRFLVFQSHADLTADDSSSGVWQVFEYNSQTGSLVRVSKGKDGFNNDGNTSVASATIPRPQYFRREGHSGAEPQPLALSNDGAFVWFQSSVGLTAQALNNVTIDESGDKANNVYEYHNGEVFLISTGQDVSVARGQSAVELLGGSASGADVFFMSGDPLVSEDVDTQQDVYDARIDGGFPARPSPVRCAGEACLGGLSGAPGLLAAGSVMQTAGDNLMPAGSNPKPKAGPKRHTGKRKHEKKRRNKTRKRAKKSIRRSS